MYHLYCSTLIIHELNNQLNNPKVWDDPKAAQKINKEKVHLEREISTFLQLEQSIIDLKVLFDISVEEDDKDSIDEIYDEVRSNSNKLHKTLPKQENSQITRGIGKSLIEVLKILKLN